MSSCFDSPVPRYLTSTSPGTYFTALAEPGTAARRIRASAAGRRRRIGIALRCLRSVRVGEHPAPGEVARGAVTSCITGATGFIGGHVARLKSEAGARPRVTYRHEGRLERLRELDVEPVRAEALDRAALRRSFRDCDVVFHTAGYVGSRPVERVWEINALAPRVTVEAAAAEGVRRVVLTSSVAGIGPSPPGEVNDEDSPFRAGGLGLTYVDAKHEGELEALAAGARLGVEVVVVNPSYVVDVRDVAEGHLAAAERARPGERYILGGHDIGWVDLVERVSRIAGVRHPLLVLPPET